MEVCWLAGSRGGRRRIVILPFSGWGTMGPAMGAREGEWDRSLEEAPCQALGEGVGFRVLGSVRVVEPAGVVDCQGSSASDRASSARFLTRLSVGASRESA